MKIRITKETAVAVQTQISTAIAKAAELLETQQLFKDNPDVQLVLGFDILMEVPKIKEQWIAEQLQKQQENGNTVQDTQDGQA